MLRSGAPRHAQRASDHAVVFVETALVLTAKAALVAPAATVTLGGTVAAAWLLDSVTAVPPAGAMLLRSRCRSRRRRSTTVVSG